MSIYKIHIENRDYSKWNLVDIESNSQVQVNLSPLSLRLFDQDIFTYSPPTSIIMHSPLRNAKIIPGILLLENNRTYGSCNKKSSVPHKKSRHFYKCIPDNPQLPAFLIPYEIQIGFSKKFINKYVININIFIFYKVYLIKKKYTFSFEK